MESNCLWYPTVRLASSLFKIPVIAWCITSKAEAKKLTGKVQNIIFEGFDPS
jgi:hypothetical protein